MKKSLIYGVAVLITFFIVWSAVAILLDVFVFGEEIDLVRSMVPAAIGGIAVSIFTIITQRNKDGERK